MRRCSYVLGAATLVLAACTRTTPHAPVEHDGAAAPPIGATSASAAASVTPPGPACTVVASLALKGAAEGGGTITLENVRVDAIAGHALVTEEWDSEPDVGDYSHAAVGAWVDWTATPPAVTSVPLPGRAYASAKPSRVGPTHATGGLGLVTFGVPATPTFALHDAAPTAWKSPNFWAADPPKAARSLNVQQDVMESFAVAASAPIAAVGGLETPCADYACPAYADQSDKGFFPSLRLVSLGAPPRTDLVWKGTARVRSGPKLVPAVAMGTTRGAVVARLDGVLTLFWLDAAFHAGPPVELDRGDVGAPAVTFTGDTAVIAWAKRDAKTDPYRLAVSVTKAGATTGAVRTVKTAASAFAPSLAPFGDHALLAWMEGDGAKVGQVKLAHLALDGPLDLESAMALSAPGTNARDPEIATAGAEVTVVWSEFGAKVNGAVQIRRLSCP